MYLNQLYVVMLSIRPLNILSLHQLYIFLSKTTMHLNVFFELGANLILATQRMN